jgi:beta-lactamase regulating signal transducer with metallopeptidase domain
MSDWLLGALCATSALMLLVLAAREPVRRFFGARVAYGLWLIPAARLLMPSLPESVPAAIRGPIFPKVHGFEPEHLISPLVPVGLWLVGAVALFAIQMIKFLRQRSAILATAEDIGDGEGIRIVKSSGVRGPVAFGLINRIVAVPVDFDARFSEDERRLALDHELYHHRSGDLIANCVAFVLLCLQWFNPLAWIAHSAFRFDQEAACDARVLDNIDLSKRADYGRAIAKASAQCTLLFANALDTRGMLQRRLKYMLRRSSASQRLTGRLSILATVAVALPLTASHARAQQVQIQTGRENVGRADRLPVGPAQVSAASVQPTTQKPAWARGKP